MHLGGSMTSTEVPPGPLKGSAPVDASTRPASAELEPDRTTQPVKVGTRILVWTGLAAAGAVFWLGVWKAIELIT
jgi:hypothetical protein